MQASLLFPDVWHHVVVVFIDRRLVVLVDSVVLFDLEQTPYPVVPVACAVGNSLSTGNRRLFSGQLDEFMGFEGAASMRQVIDMRYAATFGNLAWAPLQSSVPRLWQNTFHNSAPLAGGVDRRVECFMDGCSHCNMPNCAHQGTVDATPQFTISVRCWDVF